MDWSRVNSKLLYWRHLALMVMLMAYDCKIMYFKDFIISVEKHKQKFISYFALFSVKWQCMCGYTWLQCHQGYIYAHCEGEHFLHRITLFLFTLLFFFELWPAFSDITSKLCKLKFSLSVKYSGISLKRTPFVQSFNGRCPLYRERSPSAQAIVRYPI